MAWYNNLKKKYAKVAGKLDVLNIDPIVGGEKAKKSAKKQQRAITAQQAADEADAAAQVTNEQLAAQQQEIQSKRASITNTLALGGAPITSGSNVLAAGSTLGSPVSLGGQAPAAGAAVKVDTNPPPGLASPISAAPPVNPIRQGPKWLRSRGRI